MIFLQGKTIEYYLLIISLPVENGNSTNRRKLESLNKENCEEHHRSNLAQNSITPRSQEDYITQLSEEIEGTVTKKLSQEFSKSENRILGSLSRLDDLLLNPLLQGHSGTATETSRNEYGTNQGTNEDDSQSDPHPEAGIFQSETTRNSSLEEPHDKDTSATTIVLWHPKLCFSNLSDTDKDNLLARPQLKCRREHAKIAGNQCFGNRLPGLAVNFTSGNIYLRPSQANVLAPLLQKRFSQEQVPHFVEFYYNWCKLGSTSQL